MKALLAFLGWVLQLAFAILDKKIERDKEKKIAKEEVLGELREGIKKRDPSLVNAAFDKLRRI